MVKLAKVPNAASMAVLRGVPTAGAAESLVSALVMIWKKKA